MSLNRKSLSMNASIVRVGVMGLDSTSTGAGLSAFPGRPGCTQ